MRTRMHLTTGAANRRSGCYMGGGRAQQSIAWSPTSENARCLYGPGISRAGPEREFFNRIGRSATVESERERVRSSKVAVRPNAVVCDLRKRTFMEGPRVRTNPVLSVAIKCAGAFARSVNGGAAPRARLGRRRGDFQLRLRWPASGGYRPPSGISCRSAARC